METLVFKTNINCSGCVARVTPLLNGEPGIESWNIDINNPGKLLTVEAPAMAAEEVELLVRNAGFNIEKIQ
jgi:copper chaperone